MSQQIKWNVEQWKAAAIDTRATPVVLRGEVKTGDDYDRYLINVVCRLYWTGKRWMAWVEGVMTAEPTEFTNFYDPPIEWAEMMYETFGREVVEENQRKRDIYLGYERIS